MPQDPIADPTLVFLRTVWALDHRLQSHSKRMKSHAGVTGPQRLVLRILELVPDIAPSELARILFFHKSTVSVVLRSLEKAKLVRRAPHATDRRAVVLSLTPKGRRVVEQRGGTVESVFRKTLTKLPARDVDVARRVLDALAHAFA
jgi:MarR family transcriptional regulator, organic hydroperoxide resistance regulator